MKIPDVNGAEPVSSRMLGVQGYLVGRMRDEPTRLCPLKFDAIHRHSSRARRPVQLCVDRKRVWAGRMLEDDVRRPGLPDQIDARRDAIHMQRYDVIARIYPLVCCIALDLALPRRDDSEIAARTTGALVIACAQSISESGFGRAAII